MAAGASASASTSAGAMRGKLNEDIDKEKDGDKDRDRDGDGDVVDKNMEKDKDCVIGNLAMLRAQRAMADRLSSMGRTNLPKGVMLHDNPLSKTNAFLSQMPALT